MSQERFALVVKGTVDNSERTLTAVSEILKEKSGLEVIEVREKLSNPPFEVAHAHSRDALEGLSKEISRVGGKVTIVRSTRSDALGPPEPSERTFEFGVFFKKYSESLARILALMDLEEIQTMIESLLRARNEGKNIYVIGNGGSAAAASHFATDMAKDRFDNDAFLFRIMSLTDNTSLITATGNDFGYDRVFSNQLRNLVQKGDVVLAISSSGNSPNVIKGIELANAKGADTFGIVGFDGGRLAEVAHNTIYIPTKKGQYGYMEDVVSIICHMVSIYLFERDRALLEKSH